MGRNKVSIVCQNLGGCPSKMNALNYLGIRPPSSQGSKDRIDAILVPFGWDLILFTGLVSTEIQKYNVNLAHRGHKRAPVPLHTGAPPPSPAQLSSLNLCRHQQLCFQTSDPEANRPQTPCWI